MNDERDPLSPDVDNFLDIERRRPDPPPEVQDALFSRIGATLGWPGSGPGGSDPSGGAPPSGQIGGGAHLATHGAKHLAAGALAKTLATLAVGGVLGAGVHEAYDRTHDRGGDHAKVSTVNAAAPPAAPAIAAAPLPPADPGVPEAPGSAEAARKPEHAARGEVREHDRSLAAERALIEQARTALSRDKAEAALAALERHARDFPRGELEEERESLEVQALVGLERFDQARKVGARFHRRFPHSIFGEVVDEALKAIP